MDERLTRWLLATILAVFLLLLSLPNARFGGAPGLVERGALWVAAVIADGADSASDVVARASEAVRTRRQLEQENRDLRALVEGLQFDNARLSAVAGRLQVLEGAQGFVRQTEAELTPAEVVFHDASSSTPGWIVRSPDRRWRPGQPVLAPAGVVGRVVTGAGSYARVRPLTDYDHAMGAMIERTRRQGVVRGGGGTRLNLQYVPRGSDVRLGDSVVTSGTDGVFPRGLTIGEVVGIDERDDLLLSIGVLPGVDFATLEVVYLLEWETVSPENTVPMAEATSGEVGAAAEEEAVP